MNKTITIFISLVILVFFSFIWFLFLKDDKTDIQIENNNWVTIIKEELLKLEDKDNQEKEETIQTRQQINAQERIEILRKRFALDWIISLWDNYMLNNSYNLALEQYKKALKENQNDNSLKQKIANVYFYLNDFKESVNFFSQTINTLNHEDLNKYILAVIYSTNLKNIDDIKDSISKIRNLELSNQEKLYYINILNCSISINSCIGVFDEYSKKSTITFDKILSFQRAITNYKNFQTEQDYYRDVLITSSIFQEKIYNVSNFIWEKILQEMPSYKPILLIVWKWYYELWNLKKARDYLIQYYELEKNDKNISYLLWIISLELWDYQTSNLYLNASLSNWHKDTLWIKRLITYNYYLSWNKRSMINSFWFLLQEENSTIDDFALWIYHAILEWRTQSAITWAKLWIKNFIDIPGYEIFYWYLWWIYRENWDFEKAKDYLDEWYSINNRNPLISLNIWYLEKSQRNYSRSLLFFKRTNIINPNWEFWALAKKEIDLLEKLLIENE